MARKKQPRRRYPFRNSADFKGLAHVRVLRGPHPASAIWTDAGRPAGARRRRRCGAHCGLFAATRELMDSSDPFSPECTARDRDTIREPLLVRQVICVPAASRSLCTFMMSHGLSRPSYSWQRPVEYPSFALPLEKILPQHAVIKPTRSSRLFGIGSAHPVFERPHCLGEGRVENDSWPWKTSLRGRTLSARRRSCCSRRSPLQESSASRRQQPADHREHPSSQGEDGAIGRDAAASA